MSCPKAPPDLVRRVVSCLAVALVVAAPHAHACSCAPLPSPELAARSADLVFLATADSVGIAEVYPVPGYPLQGIWLTVEEVLVGSPSLQSSWSRMSGRPLTLEDVDGESCGFGFRPGQRYLVYARRTNGSLMGASGCGRTALAADAEDEIDWLRSRRATWIPIPDPMVGPQPDRVVSGTAFDSLAAVAAEGEARARRRVGMSMALNVCLLLALGVVAWRATHRP